MKWVLRMPDSVIHPAGELDDHERVGQQRHAEAAVLLGDLHPEEAHLLHLLDDLFGEFVVVLHLVGDGDDLPLDELADGIHDLRWSSVSSTMDIANPPSGTLRRP